MYIKKDTYVNVTPVITINNGLKSHLVVTKMKYVEKHSIFFY